MSYVLLLLHIILCRAKDMPLGVVIVLVFIFRSFRVGSARN